MTTVILKEGPLQRQTYYKGRLPYKTAYITGPPLDRTAFDAMPEVRHLHSKTIVGAEKVRAGIVSRR